MSKMVDDAVCDYFALLLNDAPTVDDAATDTSSVDSSHLRAEPSRLRQNDTAAQSKEFAPVEVEARINQQALAQLLAPVSALELKIEPKPEFEPKLELSHQDANVNSAQATILQPQKPALPEQTALNPLAESIDLKKVKHAAAPSVAASITTDLIEQLDDEFQVLFFKVAGLTLAVPLVSLGGIVNIERINHLMGRPHWYLGVQLHREAQLNIVDTCAWVMPEKYDQTLAQNVAYKYIVVLQDSNWGLTCESLVNTVKIHKSQVNWRSQAGKRPWLAGVVKEQMCGILNVEALVAMLDSGLGSQG
ncbi:chemotaxis protein CheW [Shewanella sp. GutDb-MelDb]|uniref:chemotaxis protein CheW n=1 Tax=Shewanella sp. GutDb-MelDb TaxID=2058316 RepID=UPI000C7A66B5|nr:chemotaxis protein CheW [Shewanella sp. GutDb-MelDb]PKG56577.1 chemotaxis protein CheW [Shewanella sp. GutDb-MelDb]